MSLPLIHTPPNFIGVTTTFPAHILETSQQRHSLSVDEVTTEEACFSLTISSLLLQLTKEQHALLGGCMLQAANSKDSGLSVFKKHVF